MDIVDEPDPEIAGRAWTSDKATLALAAPLSPLVLGEPSEPGVREPAGAGMSDSRVETEIVLEVSVALLADPPRQLTVIEVDSEEGVVTLRGEVGSTQLRQVAGEIARYHPGVEAAINDLQVSPASAEEPENQTGG